jgi:hypothetical protein
VSVVVKTTLFENLALVTRAITGVVTPLARKASLIKFRTLIAEKLVDTCSGP